ncbi:MAG TPA: transcriptional regulator [Lachnospiraceae bacterium]|nr:transcriptional regulator [Lachnospiraceae bacterium]
MESIRVINIPQLKVVSSGAITNMEEFEAFDKWWSAIDVSNYITPRDFMWYNEKEKYMEWVFAVPDNYSNFSNYQLVDFPGGLYAIATSKDSEEDCNSTKELIRKWVVESGCFELSTEANDTNLRYTMSHVLTPKIFKEKMGYHLSDHFVPIVAI